MIHTGDIYERRARSARHHELKAITRAISGFLFWNLRTQKHHRKTAPCVPHNVNEQTTEGSRAA